MVSVKVQELLTRSVALAGCANLWPSDSQCGLRAWRALVPFKRVAVAFDLAY